VGVAEVGKAGLPETRPGSMRLGCMRLEWGA